MTTFEKTWTDTDGNRAASDATTTTTLAKSFAWYLSRLLRNTGLGLAAFAGAWSVYYSCSSTVAGTAGDGVDRWGDAYDATKIVRGAAGAPHSWFVFSKALGAVTYYLTIDLGTTNDFQISFHLSTTAPTGGSTTASPTQGGDVVSFTNVATSSSATPQRFSGNLALDGSFEVFVANTGSGKFGFTIAVHLPAESFPSDTWRSVLWVESDFTNGVCRRAVWNAATNTTIKGRDAANGVGVNYVGTTLCIATTPILASTEMGTTDATIAPKAPDTPIWLYAYTTGAKSKRGRLQDVWHAPESLASGTIEPIAGATQTTVVGNTWRVWKNVGAAPLL